jgi:hypothetical protein
MSFTYTTTVPASGNNPSVDQRDMLQNTSSISELIAIDHVGFNNTLGGYHQVIHFNNQAGDPAVIAGVGQLYTKTSSGDQQIFYKSGGNVITQLTGPNATVPGTNGYTWLEGDILLQWGFIAGPLPSSTTTALLFSTSNIQFPNNCFNIQLTLTNPGSTGNAQTMSVKLSTVSKTGFSWNYSGGSAYNGFYWQAIGN